jgi:phosphopantetheinyl transferase
VTPRSTVEVWLIDLKRHGPAFARIAYRDDVLSPADRRRVQSFRDSADAMAFGAARAGLRQVLHRPGAVADAHLHRTRSGKPFAPGFPAFSLSHTRSHVAIAINLLGAIGVDVEPTGRNVAEHRLISRVAPLLSEGWPSNRLPIAAWTVVEAWTKLHGLTLAEVLDSPGRGRELEAAIAAKASDCHVAPLPLPADLVGACWYEGSTSSISVRDLEPEGELAASHSYPNALA